MSQILMINDIRLPADHDAEALDQKVAKLLQLKKAPEYRIVKQSLDARKKEQLLYLYSVAVEPKAVSSQVMKRAMSGKDKHLSVKVEKVYDFLTVAKGCQSPKDRPVIIGTGPAGLFCGYELARAGYRPILVERGSDVEKRQQAVNRYWEEGVLNPECNVQFGEGGAGTFSDGKLNSSIHDKTGRVAEVLRTFVDFGAPSEILWNNKPHIGTDVLRDVIANLRKEILRLGGEVCFDTVFLRPVFSEKGEPRELAGVVVKTMGATSKDKLTSLGAKPGEEPGTYLLDCSRLVLAIGHSARDTFTELARLSVPMEPKAFAVGLRVQHPQEMINASQYGTSEAAKHLPAADYKLTYQTETGRGVYSFCMCPGGYVVDASSEAERIAVNGMSNRSRDGKNANSAIVVNVTPEDVLRAVSAMEGLPEVLAGMQFQRKIEHLAYLTGSGKVPVQLLGDFEENKPSVSCGAFTPEIKGFSGFGNLRDCLPTYINDAIIDGFRHFGRRIDGFARKDAILCGVESRTSSPVRILRDEHFQSKVRGLYPCGEGAGYAGGITSAAVDGIKVAEAIVKEDIICQP